MPTPKAANDLQREFFLLREDGGWDRFPRKPETYQDQMQKNHQEQQGSNTMPHQTRGLVYCNERTYDAGLPRSFLTSPLSKLIFQ